MQRKRKRIYIAVILWMCICLFQIQEVTSDTVSATEYIETIVAVKEIDLGEYQTQMTVGEKQLLGVTVLPMDATDQNVTYASSDSSVAQINGMGRITALKAGVTEIVVSCGGVSGKFQLEVLEKNIEVTDFDLGDFPSELEVGTSQVLSVTVIPESVTEQTITYESSDTDIATVNGIGRVTAKKTGNVKITVSCANKKKNLKLKVVKAKSDEVPVTDIDIADCEEELEVDKTMSLSVTVLPSDATDSTVTYKSSNESVAMVSASGEVKGIAQGDVTITVSAGSVTKEVPLKVKVATAKIELDTTYLVLQPGESHQLSAKVLPAEANQAISYESLATDVVSITGAGVVTAKKCGTGSILVKNSDTSTAVTVIVNAGSTEIPPEEVQSIIEEEPIYENTVTVDKCPVITTDMLQYYYENNENLVVDGFDYTIKILGEDIQNWENELYTKLELRDEPEGYSFLLNEGKRICGKITLEFEENTVFGKYVYLYNDSKDKYELLQGEDSTLLTLDKEGKYLITNQALKDGSRNWIFIVCALLVLVVLMVVYILKKKKYWFW